MERLELDNGKYTIINTLHKENKEFKALRHGEEWRSLAGDNLILSMYYMIEELINENKKLKTLISADVRLNDKKEKVEVY